MTACQISMEEAQTKIRANNRTYRRRMLLASSSLTIVGVLFTGLACLLIQVSEMNPLLLAPPIIALTNGIAGIIKVYNSSDNLS